MIKANKSLCATIGFALSISFACSAAAHTRTSLSNSANPAVVQESAIYTIKEAGLQFEVPKGWKADKQADGSVVLTVEDGAITVTFLIEDKYEPIVEALKTGLKEKVPDLKSDGESKQDTHNGMVHIAETGTGSIKDVPVVWSIDVLKATKTVTILTFGIQKIMEAHGEEYAKFVTGLKKI